MTALFEMLFHFVFGSLWVLWMAGIALLAASGWKGGE